jgi:hypothetical protein
MLLLCVSRQEIGYFSRVICWRWKKGMSSELGFLEVRKKKVESQVSEMIKKINLKGKFMTSPKTSKQLFSFQ